MRCEIAVMNVNPIFGFVRTILLFLAGRVTFIKKSIGNEYIMEDGRKFKIFRYVTIATKNNVEPEAVFKIRFQPQNMGVKENKAFSRIPMMVFMGFKGFRSKLWMVDEETGLCQGIYEWQTLEDAENYSKSFAVGFMIKRSTPNSVKFEIIKQGKEKYWLVNKVQKRNN